MEIAKSFLSEVVPEEKNDQIKGTEDWCNLKIKESQRSKPAEIQIWKATRSETRQAQAFILKCLMMQLIVFEYI